MPQPTRSDVHVNAILTNVSVAYLQSESSFVARQVFPMVPVEKQSDKYFIYTKNDWLRDEAQMRGDASPSAGSGYGLSTATYSCNVFAMHKDVGHQVRANADSPINMDRDATRFVTHRLLVRMEIQWVSDYFTTSVWDTDVVGGTDFTVWSNYSASNPINDVETGKESILGVTGQMPNTLVIGYQVFRQLKHHPDVIDRIKYTSSNNVTADLLAALFEVDRVLVCQAIKATNNEGETAAYSFTHGKHALLCYVAPNPGLLTPSAGYTFSWSGVSGIGSEIAVSSFYIDELRADRIEAEMAWDNKVVGSDCGYFFSGAVA